MATEITLDTVVIAGFESSPVAADVAGNWIQNDGDNKGRIIVFVVNGVDNSTLTIDSVAACDQGSDHNGGGLVTANTEKFFGPFNPDRFNDANGRVNITYDDVTNVTVEALVIPLA